MSKSPPHSHPLALSIVLATPNNFATIARTVEHLGRQTVHDRLELVLVVTFADALELDESAITPFAAHQIVELPVFESRAAANAAGLLRARAEIVAFAEDHCFPEPDWAEALIRRHQQDCDAVGPLIRNANPRSITSWCDILINYQPWLDPRKAGPVTCLPGHNTSYKRLILAPYGDSLSDWLEVEVELHNALHQRGLKLYFDPAATVAHVNFSRATPWLVAQLHAGRSYAAQRCSDWPRLRRFVYVAGAPLIPFLRLVHVLRGPLPQDEDAPPPYRWIFPTLLGLTIDAIGQALGYLAGAGGSVAGMKHYDFSRTEHVQPVELALLVSKH